ncbi:MAG: hypothetical protein CFE28_12610 [Alphaproteobacteria bacterium PA2]|nr:MAG: hypothetical protein CFE28_12610 [Alphaproteobacteria bacterium PA2]
MRMTFIVYGGLLVLALALGLYLWGRSGGTAALRPRLATAEAAARAARQSAEEAQASGRRMVDQARTAGQAAAIAAELDADLSHSETAHAPLKADRRDRLRRADQRLCQLDPQLGGCRAADRNAPSRPPAL